MKREYDFSKGIRGKFYRPNAKFKFPRTHTKYTVSDGKLVLILHVAEEGGYVVTSPSDPALITEGETLEECFYMARDAAKCLAKARATLFNRKDRKPIAPKRKAKGVAAHS